MTDPHSQTEEFKTLLDQSAKLFQSKDFTNALPFLKKAYQLSGGEDDEITIMLAWTLNILFQHSIAKKLFHDLLKRDPDAPGVLDGYYQTLKSTGDETDAIRLLVKTVESGKRHFLYYLCGSFTDTGNFEDFKPYCQDLIDLAHDWRDQPSSTKVYKYLGDYWSGCDQWEKAFDALGEIVQKNPATMSLMIKLIRAGAHVATSHDFEVIYKSCNRFIESDHAPVWSKYQLLRFIPGENIVQTYSTEPEKSIPARDDFSDHVYCFSPLSTWLWKADQIKTKRKKYKTPVIEPKRLRENVDQFKIFVAGLIQKGCFDTFVHNFEAFKTAFGDHDFTPLFVLSTGRCGTDSLYQLLQQSEKVMPFHNMMIRSTSLDRNHLLYRIIEGNFDEAVLVRILKDYLESRTAEFLYVLRENVTPVIASHFDTVFSPFLVVLFPESRFVHLHRNETAVFKSFYEKNQWRNRQLQHWCFDPAFPDGKFTFYQDEGIPIEAQITWYLYMTKVFAEALFDTLPQDRTANIKSEHLFAKNQQEFDKLQRLLPEGTISNSAIDFAYSKPRNTKSSMINFTLDDIESCSAKVEDYLVQLETTSRL